MRPVKSDAWLGGVHVPEATARRWTTASAASASSAGAVGRAYPYVERWSARTVSSTTRRTSGRRSRPQPRTASATSAARRAPCGRGIPSGIADARRPPKPAGWSPMAVGRDRDGSGRPARVERAVVSDEACGGGPASAAGPDDDAVPLVAERAPFPAEQLEMRERLDGRGQHLEAVLRVDREGVERHLVGRARPAPDRVQHAELPHAVEVDELARAAAMVLVDGPVRGADEARLDALDLLVRGE